VAKYFGIVNLCCVLSITGLLTALWLFNNDQGVYTSKQMGFANASMLVMFLGIGIADMIDQRAEKGL
jgi:purine-cytosine permease-like protein